MLVQIPNVLNTEQVAAFRRTLEAAAWVDGAVTAGHQSRLAKSNMQLSEDDPAAIEMGDLIMAALERDPLFIAAALPKKIFPPLFNRYSGGQNFGTHIDNAIRQVTGTAHRVRTDLSATLFLADPGEYDGGELVIEDNFGVQRIKLAAGSLILYPASSLHHVTPVTRGTRLASFFWIESMVRDDGQRAILFDLDLSIQEVAAESPDSRSAVKLTGVYHNLLRRWADV
ncbi:MAG TPA: Fe2+-dependent dioxygenase [Pyrinomonadaceae bacterium]|nr:Fe2+-dependent dioxygenase [Pyrinomonadaceae bacterium]